MASTAAKKVVYIGQKSVYNGKPLFKILAHLKDFGRGRIVYRTREYEKHPGKVHFYRILYAQPEMDEDTVGGRVVVERVFQSHRYPEPEVLTTATAKKPDFRLVAKDEEAEFCQWDAIDDYSKEKHATTKPEFMAMPPLLKLLMERGRISRGESTNEEDFYLPASEIYEGEFNIEKGKVQSDWMGQYFKDDERYANYANFHMDKVPADDWNLRRFNKKHPIGVKSWHGYVEGRGWEEQQKFEDS